MPEERVERFNLAERLGHWSHGITFVVLLLTGSALVFRSYAGLIGPGGLRLFRSIHHVMAYPFTFLTVIILLLGTPRTAGQWLKECLTWGRDDLRFIAAFPREFFGLKVQLPEQGKFNAGEKLNSLLTIAGSILMVVTGWILLLRDSVAPALVAWALPLHSAGALVMGGVILGHIYLALGHPNSRESINGMLSGKVSARFAREHHARWYRELKAGGNQGKKQQKIA
ncbi:formate dehydrogenase subunit gamma [Neomoorella mulderi]|uniref:Formate dehydrogenase, cytochrome b556(Fdo) subunit n=1 Tax=Moorella mulderi DSM 14980 TaxID=1122241 RepID=A0A151AVN2_9FIRM|nr:cytochrome b/b6 domain-containing protein [Moorella mulderi]KYH31715.1 formate dehydrogenase, cytochrome b556(fdo) subunit [Moorella mulderi DSM 14980]